MQFFRGTCSCNYERTASSCFMDDEQVVVCIARAVSGAIDEGDSWVLDVNKIYPNLTEHQPERRLTG